MDAALSDLRWHSDTSDSAELLRRIGDFPGYWIVLIDGKMATAPDDRNRVLAAVFTSEHARDLFLDALPEAVAKALNQKVVIPINGRDLFARLGDMPLDGIVFNCSGPGKPVAFKPALCQRVRGHIDSEPRPPAAEPAGVDFDAMAKAAFPNLEKGPIPAINALWRACFALDEWVFTVHPKSFADPRPFITTEAGHPSVFAFTDPTRARRFAAANDLLGPGGDAVYLSMTPAAVLDWARDGKSNTGALRLHFNFGDPGWYSPLTDLPRIQDYLRTHPE